jgi:hypothetical protein
MMIGRINSRLKLLAFRWRSSPATDLSCGDCERVESCGLPPHPECEERLAQMETAERYNLPARRSFADAGL